MENEIMYCITIKKDKLINNSNYHKKTIRQIKVIALAFLFFFSEILQNGNLDLLFVLGLLNIVCVFNNRKEIKLNILFALFLLFCTILSSTFSPFYTSFYHSFITGLKLLLCFNSLLLFAKQRIKFKDFLLGSRCFEILCIIFTIVALVTQSQIFWYGNRIKLLFFEPSDMCFYLSICSFVEAVCIFKNRSLSSLFILLCDFIIAILGQSISGIFYTIMLLSLAFLLFYNRKNNILVITFIILLFIISLIVILNFQTSPIVERIISVFSGKDVSTNFRVFASIEILPILLKESSFLGVGLGNFDLDPSLSFLISHNIPGKFSNAYPYFIAETGVWGILFLIYLYFQIIRSTKKATEFYKRFSWCLILYSLISSLAGNWITNPGLWCLLGIILGLSRNTYRPLFRKKVL